MTALWDLPDFDEHELVHFVTDAATGLRAVIGVHSTHLGPGAGGTRLWHYAKPEDAVGGDPGPHTSYGVFLGVKAAVKRALGKDSLAGLHIALQGAGSVASGLARRAAAEGARLSIADVDHAKAQALAAETGGTVVGTDAVMSLDADVFSPNALGAILTEASIAALQVPVVAGGANNQLATRADGDRLHGRGILYAPDYVINAGGIINVSTEYLGDGDQNTVRDRIETIPGKLEAIWQESAATGRNAAEVADAMAQRLIGRA